MGGAAKAAAKISKTERKRQSWLFFFFGFNFFATRAEQKNLPKYHPKPKKPELAFLFGVFLI